jgi:DNA-binding beta-propeller fold protein YncE
MSLRALLVSIVLAVLALAGLTSCESSAPVRGVGATPRFAVDPYWPKPLPENWILGQVAGIAVDANDHIWIVHRPGTLVDDEKGAMANPPTTRCCRPAPPILKFDRDGNLLAHWGGPGAGYDWPVSEHGIFVDRTGNVWLAGNSLKDHQILKFSGAGNFLQQIGKPGVSLGSNNPTQLGRPAHMIIDAPANELFVADGYGNRRVIVFDAGTLAYKRHWGAYGAAPVDDKTPPYNAAAPLSRQFGSPVHCVRVSRDGLVYVCDRENNRIQVFERGGKFMREFRIEPETLQNGSVWDLVLSEDPAERYIFIADGANNQILVIRRDNGEVLSRFSRAGRMAGELKWVHNMAIDSGGNLYTAEVGTGRRTQKFKRVH